MTLAEIRDVHRRFWRKGYGSVTPAEALFISERIVRARPSSFLEIGSASGLSGGLICRFLAEAGARRFESWDLSERFFHEPSKRSGFLIGEIAAGLPLEIGLRHGVTSLDLHASGRRFDMAFVDANHRHPWPLIDTVALFEVLEGPRVAIHHDLRLHIHQDRPAGIGPKFLYDQVPEARRLKGSAKGGNIFALDLTMTTAEFAAVAEAALHLPWTLDRPLGAGTRGRVRELLRRALGEGPLAAFDRAAARYDAPAPRWRVGWPAPLARLMGG